MKFSKSLQFLAVLAIGAVGGFIAASRDTMREARAEVQSPAAGTATQPVSLPIKEAASVRPQDKLVPTAQKGKQPNILFIMGDDIGMWNIGAYHRGLMAGRTPNLDKLAKEGMLFTDYYAEASCTAGRANFITGQLPIRTGMTTVGQAGAPTGLP